MRATARQYDQRKRTSNTTARLEARVSGEQKALFLRAAALRGVTFTDFIIDSLREAAVRTIEEHDVLRLTIEDKRDFVDALMNPPAPNAALRKAAERYRRLVEPD